jgi:hypothetical protein
LKAKCRQINKQQRGLLAAAGGCWRLLAARGRDQPETNLGSTWDRLGIDLGSTCRVVRAVVRLLAAAGGARLLAALLLIYIASSMVGGLSVHILWGGSNVLCFYYGL